MRSFPAEEKGDGNRRQDEDAYDGTKDDPDFRFLLHGCDEGVYVSVRIEWDCFRLMVKLCRDRLC